MKKRKGGFRTVRMYLARKNPKKKKRGKGNPFSPTGACGRGKGEKGWGEN